MAFYKKTQEKINNTIASTDRENINCVFTSFFRKYHKENVSFANQRSLLLFGSLTDSRMIEDIVEDIYFQMLIIDQSDLEKMNETDLLKIFRSMVNSPAFTGALLQQLKYASHEDIDDYE